MISIFLIDDIDKNNLFINKENISQAEINNFLEFLLKEGVIYFLKKNI